MKMWLVIGALALGQVANAQDLPGEIVYERCSGAVVQLRVLDDLGRVKSTGSGVVFKDSAWLITNNHILERGGLLLANKGADRLDLKEIVRSDADADILIVRIDPATFPDTWANIPPLQPVRFDGLRPGQRVFTIGNPRGLDNTIADGVLSARRVDEETHKRMLQISAPISPGSSGGGVFDARGRLIGISTFIYRPGISQNLNFAVSIEDVILWDRKDTRLDIKQVEMHPEFISGMERWKEHDCKGSIAHFRLVPDTAAHKSDALYYTARCLQMQGDIARAREGYERAVALDPRHARAHSWLATALYQQGDYSGAIEHQGRAYELDPSLRDPKVAAGDW